MRSNRVQSHFVAAILVLLYSSTFGFSQDQRKTLEWANHTNKNTGKVDLPWSKQSEAIELEDVLVDGRAITIGEQFVAQVDWIRDLTFRVKNVSLEEVGFVQLTVTLPQIKSSPQIPFTLQGKSQKGLMPGEEGELRIAGENIYNWVRDQVAREKDISTISQAVIYSVLVTSRQSRNWIGGCLKTADPRNACRLASQ